jgi:hypothetical protein
VERLGGAVVADVGGSKDSGTIFALLVEAASFGGVDTEASLTLDTVEVVSVQDRGVGGFRGACWG